ncbi:pentapeptide repeat-containing protein [Helicobacter cholecystus]|uniref:pentapeptide repeat-containing protein n=1 Tax=Helicobacter cholecystus TaxID=45498 RepID=UPI002739E59C|nr:pentapeptide repeat-containing protein [Helicobacter cholecystus]
MQEGDFFIQSQNEAQKYFDDMDEAISAICFALFPYNPTIEAIGGVKQIIHPCSYPSNAKVEYLDYKITPIRHLDLGIMELWKIRQYKLHFHNAPSLCLTDSFNTFTRYEIGDDEIDEYMDEIKNVGEMSFENCHFGEIGVHQCRFKKLVFRHCTFKKSVIFNSCIFEEIVFEDCVFEDFVSITNSYFKDETHIQGEFKKQTTFSNCAFGEKDNHQSGVFFDRSTFRQIAFFTRTRFYGECTSFYKTVFEKTPNFSQAIFQTNLNLINSKLNFDYGTTYQVIKNEEKHARVSFLLLQTAQNANDFRDSFRIFKNTLSKEGNLLDASNYHRVELYCKEIELHSKLKESWNWRDWIDKWQLCLYRHTSDHHTDLLKIISWVMIVIGYFGLGFFIIRYFQDSSILLHLNPYGIALSFGGVISLGALLIMRYIQKIFFFAGIGLISTLWIACYKPTLIFGAMNLIDKSSRSGLENLLTVLYTLAMILLLFSLQKTARKNSIIPS